VFVAHLIGASFKWLHGRTGCAGEQELRLLNLGSSRVNLLYGMSVYTAAAMSLAVSAMHESVHIFVVVDRTNQLIVHVHLHSTAMH
jgi:hypothetical protein